MNKKQKGHKAETDLAKAMRNKGYAVQVAQRTSVFTGKFYVSKDNDFFNLFDLLAISKLWVLLIQVKTNINHIYTVLPKLKEFANNYSNLEVVVIAALKVLRKGYVFWIYNYFTTEFDKVYFNLKFENCEPFKYS